MTHAYINLYSNKKNSILSLQKRFVEEGYNCKAIERLGENGTPGHSKYCLTIYHPSSGRITQEEYNAFEEKILEIYGGIKR